MKTIEEAAEIHAIKRHGDRIIHSVDRFESRVSFHAGAAFAQRWIPIEEELPPVGVRVLTKWKEDYDEGVVVHQFIGNDFEFGFITHWRPIELK